jgi:hypothetical protein
LLLCLAQVWIAHGFREAIKRSHPGMQCAPLRVRFGGAVKKGALASGCKASARFTRQLLQPEATEATMGVTNR